MDYDNKKLHIKYGFISKKGNILIDPQYDYATDFKNNFAIVSYKINDVVNFVIFDKLNNRYDVLPQYVKENNSEDDAHVGFYNDGLFAVKLANKKWGFIDIKGNLIIKPQYDYLDFEDYESSQREKDFIPYFYKGKAFVKKSEKIFIINKQNEVLKEIEAVYLSKFSDDVAFTYNIDKQVTGAIDVDGNILFDNKENRTFGKFSDGVCWFTGEEDYVDSDGEKTSDAKVLNRGYIDKTGKIILKVPQYKSLGNFKDGIAPVEKNSSNDDDYDDTKGEIIFIDKTGRVIFEQ